MQLEINFPSSESSAFFYTWFGYQPGVSWDRLMDLQDKFLDNIPFSDEDSQLWKVFQFAPTGWKYDNSGNLYKIH